MTYTLGRIREHDPRSRNFAVQEERKATQIISVDHLSHLTAPLDQGSLGSCTGNAATACLATDPVYHAGLPVLDENLAVSIYQEAILPDTVADDPGSSGLAVAKVAQKRGYISRYEHVFDWNSFLTTLVNSPVIVGVDWYSGMFQPSKTGVVNPTGKVVGGHEFLVYGLSVSKKQVHCLNSWGSDWGVRGGFRISFHNMQKLLDDGGDATLLVR